MSVVPLSLLLVTQSMLFFVPMIDARISYPRLDFGAVERVPLGHKRVGDISIGLRAERGWANYVPASIRYIQVYVDKKAMYWCCIGSHLVDGEDIFVWPPTGLGSMIDNSINYHVAIVMVKQFIAEDPGIQEELLIQ